MRLTIAFPLLAGFALNACGSGSGSVQAENESVSEVARKVAAADIKPRPGRWESQVKFENLEMEGMPAGMKEAMAKQLGEATSYSSCLTPEQVDQPDGGFFAGGADDCTYKKFSMAGGRVDAEMTCRQQGMTQAMTMAGTYSETSYDIRMESQSQVQAGQPIKMTVAVTSRRTGECDGKEDITAEDMKKMQEYGAKTAR